MREVLLLRGLEGFCKDETAILARRTQEEVGRLGREGLKLLRDFYARQNLRLSEFLLASLLAEEGKASYPARETELP